MSNALFGLLGTLVGAFIPWLKEALIRKLTRKEQTTYSKLGLEAIDIIDNLRATYNLPEKLHASQSAAWNPKAVLEEKIRKLEKQKPTAVSLTENTVTSSGENGVL